MTVEFENDQAYMSAGDAAKYLGVSYQTMYRWIRTGVIPAFRPRGTRKFILKIEDLDAWVKGGSLRPTKPKVIQFNPKIKE